MGFRVQAKIRLRESEQTKFVSLFGVGEERGCRKNYSEKFLMWVVVRGLRLNLSPQLCLGTWLCFGFREGRKSKDLFV